MLREAELGDRYVGNRQGDTPGKRLRRARLDKKMTIRELAKTTGLTPEGLSHLEADKNPASLRSLKKLSEVLGQPIEYLGCFQSMPEDTPGQRIRKARISNGLTLQEASSILGVDWTTLKRWEHDASRPSKRFTQALNVFMER